MQSAATLSSKHQVTIPKAAREQLDLGAGDRISFTFGQSRLVVAKIPDVGGLAGSLRSFAKKRAPTNAKMEESVLEYRKREYVKKEARSR